MESYSAKHLQQAGFSLTELVIILAIIGLLSAVAVPNLAEMMPRFRLSNATQRIMTDLQFARMRAIATNKEYRLNFNPSVESYLIEEGNQSSGSTWPGTTMDLERKFNDSNNLYYQKNIDIASVNQNPVFSPKGLSSATTTIHLQNDHQDKKTITLNIAGKIKVTNGWN